eukprot:9382814-Ditylum_brightwellii.AAC.1
MTSKLQECIYNGMAKSSLLNGFALFLCCGGDIGIRDVWNLLELNADGRDVPCMDIEADIGEAKWHVGVIGTGIAAFAGMQDKEEGDE